MQSFKASSTILINRWRTVKEYNGKVECFHLNPVRVRLVRQADEWPWSSVREYFGVLQEEATRPLILPIDGVPLPSDQPTRI